MKILPEFFDPNQFHVPNTDNHFIIKRPYTTFSKSMVLDFKEYNTNLKIQCIVFDRIWQTCINIYGLRDAKRKVRCFESLNYFNQCLKINSFISNDKKYYGHTYADSKYQNLSPGHDEIVD